jgi:hypothetical protein
VTILFPIIIYSHCSKNYPFVNYQLQLGNLLWKIFIRDWLIILIIFKNGVIKWIVLLQLLSSEPWLNETFSQEVGGKVGISQIRETSLVCVNVHLIQLAIFCCCCNFKLTRLFCASNTMEGNLAECRCQSLACCSFQYCKTLLLPLQVQQRDR